MTTKTRLLLFCQIPTGPRKKRYKKHTHTQHNTRTEQTAVTGHKPHTTRSNTHQARENKHPKPMISVSDDLFVAPPSLPPSLRYTIYDPIPSYIGVKYVPSPAALHCQKVLRCPRPARFACLPTASRTFLRLFRLLLLPALRRPNAYTKVGATRKTPAPYSPCHENGGRIKPVCAAATVSPSGLQVGASVAQTVITIPREEAVHKTHPTEHHRPHKKYRNYSSTSEYVNS